MWLMRKLLGSGAVEIGHHQDSWAIEHAAGALTFAERALLGRVALPIGTSVLCVATRAARHRR
jgi:hypothetical protein